MPDDEDRTDDEVDADAVAIVIDGTLDLHHFHPKDLRTLIPDYLAECHARGIFALRIIHGRGIGAVQRSVHALLSRSPLVASYRLAEAERGGRGATLVDLKP
jgi:DNA-nicking Smr family endonuclease